MSNYNKCNLQGRKVLFEHSRHRAFDCLNDREYSRAFAHLIVALTIHPDVEDELLNIFLYTLGRLCDEHEQKESWNEVLMCYEQALDVLPSNAYVLHGLATLLFRLGYVESATGYFQKAFRENPFFTPSLYCVDNIKNALVERWHFMMLNDKKRNMAYSEAITRAVKCGYKHVLDIGAGTGIFSMMAEDAGAEKVYACEGSQVMFKILQRAIEANKKPVQLFEKFSHDLVIPVDIPQKVTLVVTEIFDAGLLGEHALKTLKHVWEHLIKDDVIEEKIADLENLCISSKGEVSVSDEHLVGSTASVNSSMSVGRIIPQSATVWAVPIQCESIRNYIWADKKVLHSLGIPNASISASVSGDDPYTTERLVDLPGGYKCLSVPNNILKVDFSDIKVINNLLEGRSIHTTFDCSVTGQLDAIALWFTLHLDDKTAISTSPEHNAGCWEQAVFYVAPQHLQGSSQFLHEGDSIKAEFLCKGHLSLKSAVSTAKNELSDGLEFSSLDPAIIYQLNSLANVLSLNLCAKSCPQTNFLVIDISTFPLVGLKALLEGAQKLVVLRSKYQRYLDKLQDMCNIPKEKVAVMLYEDLLTGSLQSSMLVVEPIEVYGLLKKNIFEDIALLRKLHPERPPVVVPGEIGIYAMLIDSSTLFEQMKLVSDERCAGYKIAQFLNAYQCSIHQDVQFSTLVHEKLCDVIKLCDINLNNMVQEKNKLQYSVEMNGTIDVTVTKTGKISAILYWFRLKYDEECTVDTSSPENLWRQAASIPENEISVIEGNKVALQWACRNSCLHISVEKN